MRSVAKKMLAFGLAGCMAVMGLAGCSQPQAEETSAAVEEEQPAYDLVIGTEDDAVVHLPVTNGTDGAITGVQVKDVASADYSANLMEPGQVWESGQVADVFFAGVLVDEVTVDGDAKEGEEGGASDSSAAAAAAAETESVADDAAAIEAALLDDIILLPMFDVQITMADGSAVVLHQLTLGTLMYAEDIAINVDAESGAAYLTYVENGSSASTLIAELQVIAEEEALAQEAAEAEAAAAAAAAQSASQPKSSGSGGGSYDSVAPSGGGSGSGSGGSAPSQSEDSCVSPDDLIFN